MVGRFCVAVVGALTTLLAAGACGPDSSPGSAGSLTVFAAASLTESFTSLHARLRVSNPGLSLTFSFAGSGALVTQVTRGAPADVIATADTSSMRRLSDAGLVDPPITFAANTLEILVEPGNPKAVRGLHDLSRTDIKLVIADENVPAGRYSAQVLEAAGVTVRPVSKEVDVRAAVAKVTAGEADATIVYATDVTAAGSKGQGVRIPDGLNVVAAYPIAVAKATRNRAAASAFVAAVLEGDGQDELRRRGFLPPT
jgi:molybdate transport system substrate-binding protein